MPPEGPINSGRALASELVEEHVHFADTLKPEAFQDCPRHGTAG